MLKREPTFEVTIHIPRVMKEHLEIAITQLMDQAEYFGGWVEWDEVTNAELEFCKRQEILH